MHPKPAKPKHKHPAVHACVDDIAELAWYALKGTVNTCIQLSASCMSFLPHAYLHSMRNTASYPAHRYRVSVDDCVLQHYRRHNRVLNYRKRHFQTDAGKRPGANYVRTSKCNRVYLFATYSQGIIDVLNLIGDGVTKGLHKIESIF